MWFIGVEVEQETSAPPPKKNPGSAPVSIDHLAIGDTRVSPVTGAKNLGTNGLNSNLNLNEHINKTCKIAYFHLHNIR